ncbi:MAG: PhnD/SsuA/transferrin family substrate-binding protein [Parasulfuritortus sp.]|nr:PhnD/SsuA/transferrin family substrate-binding protein [Parasulfuritortus sp.]
MKLIRTLLALTLWLAGFPAQAEPAAPEQPPLKMGFYLPAIRDANIVDLKVSLGVWTEEVGRPYGVKIYTSTYNDMRSIRRAIDQGELNFINAPGMELAEIFKPDELRQGYARRHAGIDEGVAIIVAANSGIQHFVDLRGKRVERINNDHLSEYFLETQCLKTSGQDCQHFLVLKESSRDIQSVYDVFFGRTDAALVSLATLRTARELNPQVGDRIKVILDWKAKALIFGMMTRYTDPNYRSLILKSINEAIKTPRARQILELFKTDYLEPIDASDLEPYRTMLAEYNLLRKKNRGRK